MISRRGPKRRLPGAQVVRFKKATLVGFHLAVALGEQAGAAHKGIEAPDDCREEQHQEVPVISPAYTRAQEQAVVVLRASAGCGQQRKRICLCSTSICTKTF